MHDALPSYRNGVLPLNRNLQTFGESLAIKTWTNVPAHFYSSEGSGRVRCYEQVRKAANRGPQAPHLGVDLLGRTFRKC